MTNMYVAKENYNLEYIFINKADTPEERVLEIKKYEKQGYDLTGTQDIFNGLKMEYNARLEKLVEKIEKQKERLDEIQLR